MFPCLIAGLQDVSGRFTGCQATYLSEAGDDKQPFLKQPRKNFGCISGSAVRLASAAEALVIAEGIETALSVQQATGMATWAALSAYNLARLILPDCVKTVIIAADNDHTGVEAARAASDRFAAEGRSVSIVRPSLPGADFNDLLLEV
jgi:phage/plasmid primase-like uncharacterized protein